MRPHRTTGTNRLLANPTQPGIQVEYRAGLQLCRDRDFCCTLAEFYATLMPSNARPVRDVPTQAQQRIGPRCGRIRGDSRTLLGGDGINDSCYN